MQTALRPDVPAIGRQPNQSDNENGCQFSAANTQDFHCDILRYNLPPL